MAILVPLVAGAVIATAPATPLPWFTLDDYPTKAFGDNLQGVTNFSVLVAPDGRAVSCTIDKSSGHAVLDRQTCWIAVKRARFTSARGADGRPAYGEYRSQIVWRRPDRAALQRGLGPDLAITVNQLPAGTNDPAVKLAYFVDAQGNPSACTPLPDSARQPQTLVDAACKAWFDHVARQPVTANGAAVGAVRTAAVEISGSN